MEALAATLGGLGLWIVVLSLPVIVLLVMAWIRKDRPMKTSDLDRPDITQDGHHTLAEMDDDVPKNFDQSA